MKINKDIINPHLCYTLIVVVFVFGLATIKYFYDRQINYINEELESIDVK